MNATLNRDNYILLRIRELDIRCNRRLLNITFKDQLTNLEIRKRILQEIGSSASKSELLAVIRERTLKQYCHVTRSN